MTRKALLHRLQSTLKINGHLLAVALGNGMAAQFAKEGGADLILAISAGRIRQMGQSAFTGFFSSLDTNKMVMDFGTKEILPIVGDFPVIFGIFAQDPCIHLYEYLQKISYHGFTGVINYPSVGFFKGHFRDALESSDLGYEKEIEMIRIAHFLGMFTAAYVFDGKQAKRMVEAGADLICVHFGITGGGILGANRFMSLELAMELAEDIFQQVDEIRPGIIKMISGGPVLTPIDTQAFYQNTRCQGFLGGSPIERLPVERAMIHTVRAFKSPGDFNRDNVISQVLNGNRENIDYGEFMLEYIHKHYKKCIRLKDLSIIAHISASRLSVLFKEKTGCSFTDYLIGYRMEKAKEWLRETDSSMKEISEQVGYEDYSQFTKMFKKVIGQTPQEYRRSSK